jgi:hypothetical protein
VQLACFCLALAALAAFPPAHALLIRADRDDAEYVELATRYSAAIALPGGGEAVLVAPRWLLTAAHRAKALRDGDRIATVDGDREVQAIRSHPEWKGGVANDIALVLLRKPVAGSEPLRFYRWTDEAGKAVVIVGHGESGPIGRRPAASDRRARAGINTIDRVEPRALGLRIKPPDDASDLQAALAAADTGAPAIIEIRDELYVAGVAAATDGEWETYARVSAYVPWMEAVMLDVAKRELESMLDPDRR